MRVAAIQSEIVWEDPSENFQRLRPWIAAAAAAGARLVALPEMFACGFSMETARISEPPGGRTTAFLRGARRGRRGCGSAALCQSCRRATAKPYNTLVIAGPGGELHRYQKIHPFTFAGEHLHYAAGEQHLTVTIEGARCTFFVCYDLRFADEFWALALEQTDVYVVVANWPARRRQHWMHAAAGAGDREPGVRGGGEPGGLGERAGVQRGLGDHRPVGGDAGERGGRPDDALGRDRPGSGGRGPREAARAAGPPGGLGKMGAGLVGLFGE
jgi:hypothetical protein